MKKLMLFAFVALMVTAAQLQADRACGVTVTEGETFCVKDQIIPEKVIPGQTFKCKDCVCPVCPTTEVTQSCPVVERRCHKCHSHCHERGGCNKSNVCSTCSRGGHYRRGKNVEYVEEETTYQESAPKRTAKKVRAMKTKNAKAVAVDTVSAE